MKALLCGGLQISVDRRPGRKEEHQRIGAKTPRKPLCEQSLENKHDQEVERETQEQALPGRETSECGEGDQEEHENEAQKVVGNVDVTWEVPHNVVEAVQGDNSARDDQEWY